MINRRQGTIYILKNRKCIHFMSKVFVYISDFKVKIAVGK